MTDLRIPDLGEGVESGVVIAVLVAAGDTLEAEQGVLEIETDKVTLEIPAPRAGVIREVCVAVDAVVKPGDVVLRIDETATGTTARQNKSTPTALPPATTESVAHSANPAPHPPEFAPEAGSHDSGDAAVIPAGPAARREARELGIDISQVSGSGRRARITRDDVRAFVKARHAHGTNTAHRAGGADCALPDLSAFGAVRREPLSRIARVTATNLSQSVERIPHAWVERRIDITRLEAARQRLRARQAADSAPLTLTALLCKALALALVDFPQFNAAFDPVGDAIVYRDYINIGVAVDTPRGLLVPVIRNVDTLSMLHIATQLARLSAAARDGDLDAGALRGAGITISNLGGLGVSAMQPIVNWPQAAILGVAAAQATAIEIDGQWMTQARLPLTLGFDHRLINGADAARLLARLDILLSEPLEIAAAL